MLVRRSHPGLAPVSNSLPHPASDCPKSDLAATTFLRARFAVTQVIDVPDRRRGALKAVERETRSCAMCLSSRTSRLSRSI